MCLPPPGASALAFALASGAGAASAAVAVAGSLPAPLLFSASFGLSFSCFLSFLALTTRRAPRRAAAAGTRNRAALGPGAANCRAASACGASALARIAPATKRALHAARGAAGRVCSDREGGWE